MDQSGKGVRNAPGAHTAIYFRAQASDVFV